MTNFSKLSIVVPVGPDDQVWPQLLNELAVFGSEAEIILSACQPRSADSDLPNNANWLCGVPGRAHQLNAGAKQATRELVWFVHADTRLSEDVVTAVGDFIAKGGQILGYFRLRFAGDGPCLTRLNAAAANLRSRFFGLPFGDQGFIIRKTLFEQLQGFDQAVSLGEDLDFAVRVKAAGFSLRELPAVLVTSARRYQQQGWLATTVRHICLTWQLNRQAKQRLESVR
ncbi:TIGR04283 family arsenosugar biosynthesis glycosyltransferase [Methylomarinum sp. Ch1-1]|uniref:TIGR04283 family arsenosugar biosynthesis glycosyltransferase n=1 Tax=Methylomarinum roseum TaxID=3067653 RepID=A0AAU7NZD2_9GAMM|nr:TIGR04283 family arsenosugar biosynthesis glycosyltransferase [Methylomarinum sp. Ch1-1]MDP4521467.1 TIGR04283 family arsenosugar biosynthesis glycosyltransferase [Methylomarinum sp. Ch1-1]